MAREVVIRMLDDLDRTQEASEAITIGYRGFIYELDLTAVHAEELNGLLQPWITAAHDKVKWPKRSQAEAKKAAAERKPARPKSTLTPEERKEARQWGRENGFTVATRGYIPQDVIKAWKKTKRSEANPRSRRTA
jgi:hypothetical protein